MKIKRMVMMAVLAVFTVFADVYAEANLCYEYVKQGEYDKGIEECTRFLNKGGNNIDLSEAYYMRGHAYREKGQYDQAIADHTRSIELVPIVAATYNDRGLAYDAKGQYDQAIADYTKALELRPDRALVYNTYNNRGIAYKNRGQNGQAIQDFTKALELNPKDASAYGNRGNTYFDRGQHDQAIADYTRAIELYAKYADAYYGRGLAYKNSGQYDQAIKDFTKVIELDPKDDYAYRNRGNAYQSKGQYDQAVADFTKAIGLNSKDDYGYLRFLIATWLAKGNDSGPLDRLRQHVSTSSSNEWVRTISRYYLGIDKMTEQSVFEEARRGKDGKEVNERLCEAYYYIGVKRFVAGKRKDAADYFTKSVETDVKNFDEYGSSKVLLEQINKGKI